MLKKNILSIFLCFLCLNLFAEEKSIDDSKYDDKTTIEFCLETDTKRFCLYHNINNIKGIDTEKCEVVKDWSTDKVIRKWLKLAYNELSVTWNYSNGAIVFLETMSPIWRTKRGIKVGDPINKVKEVYGNDSNLAFFDYKSKKYNYEPTQKGKLFLLMESDDGFSLNAGNFLEEEMMTILFHNVDGKISKIEVLIGH